MSVFLPLPCFFFFPDVPSSLLLFSVWRTAFRHSFRVGLWMSKSLILLSSENVLIVPYIFKGYFHQIRITFCVHSSFLSALKKYCIAFFVEPRFMKFCSHSYWFSLRDNVAFLSGCFLDFFLCPFFQKFGMMCPSVDV